MYVVCGKTKNNASVFVKNFRNFFGNKDLSEKSGDQNPTNSIIL